MKELKQPVCETRNLSKKKKFDRRERGRDIIYESKRSLLPRIEAAYCEIDLIIVLRNPLLVSSLAQDFDI